MRFIFLNSKETNEFATTNQWLFWACGLLVDDFPQEITNQWLFWACGLLVNDCPQEITAIVEFNSEETRKNQ
jgi:hypothetical protein